jgi:hypothetical protein
LFEKSGLVTNVTDASFEANRLPGDAAMIKLPVRA